VTFRLIDDDFLRVERLDKLIFDEKLAKKENKIKSKARKR
jgi:hypothetical protein